MAYPRPVNLGHTRRTTGEFLEWWVRDLKAFKRLAPETYRSYEAKVRLHLKPDLDKIRLAKLSPVDVRQLITRKVAAGLSTKQVNHIHDVLHTALEQARKLELIDRNVASLVDPPRIVSKERRALTVEQASKLLVAMDGDPYEALFRTLLTLGLRPGEGLGLQWSSVAFDARTIRIESTLQRVQGKWTLKEPKTPASKQTLPLPAPLASTLKLQLERQNEMRRDAGLMWEEWGLVFTRPAGLPIWHSEAGLRPKALCRMADVPEITLHELRHSTPSILLSLGVDQRVIMSILRHSTIVLTANLYTHVANPLVREALARIDDALPTARDASA